MSWHGQSTRNSFSDEFKARAEELRDKALVYVRILKQESAEQHARLLGTPNKVRLALWMKYRYPVWLPGWVWAMRTVDDWHARHGR